MILGAAPCAIYDNAMHGADEKQQSERKQARAGNALGLRKTTCSFFFLTIFILGLVRVDARAVHACTPYVRKKTCARRSR